MSPVVFSATTVIIVTLRSPPVFPVCVDVTQGQGRKKANDRRRLNSHDPERRGGKLNTNHTKITNNFKKNPYVGVYWEQKRGTLRAGSRSGL